MDSFLAQFVEGEIVALSGISASTMSILWNKYCGPNTPIRLPIYLWWLFVFLKMYSIERGLRTIHGGLFRSNQTFLRRIYRWQVILSIFAMIMRDLRCTVIHR